MAHRILVARAVSLETGYWHPALETPAGHPFGALVVDGLLTRRLTLGGRHSVELIGRGDVVRPDQPECDEYVVVASRAEWRVLQPATFAVIDEDLISGLVGLPGILAELAGRVLQRSRTLAVRLAIAQMPRLDERLYLLLWHLADRWGRTHTDGIVLPLRLSQDTLAELVCARRSSVNGALRTLTERGAIRLRHDRTWLLAGDPPDAPAGPEPLASPAE